MVHGTLLRISLLVAALLVGGCNVLSPKPIPTEKQYLPAALVDDKSSPIEVGRPIKWLDTIGWIIGIPSKILLWDRRMDNHKITEPTLDATAIYLEANELPHVKVRMNQYAPLEDLKRLRKNNTVGWPYRYTIGLLSVGGEAIFAGRVFGGDHFNPFTQTVHLYSDSPAIAYHELGHAKDFSRRKWQGTYAILYGFVPSYHEVIASRDALDYVYDRHDRDGIIEANRLLYPAMGTYGGNALGYLSPANAVALYYGTVVAGHINGRMLSRNIDQHLAQYDAVFKSRQR